MVSTLFMVDTSSHPRAQLHRCVEKSVFPPPTLSTAPPWSAPRPADTVDRSTVECSAPWTSARSLASLDQV